MKKNVLLVYFANLWLQEKRLFCLGQCGTALGHDFCPFRPNGSVQTKCVDALELLKWMRLFPLFVGLSRLSFFLGEFESAEWTCVSRRIHSRASCFWPARQKPGTRSPLAPLRTLLGRPICWLGRPLFSFCFLSNNSGYQKVLKFRKVANFEKQLFMISKKCLGIHKMFMV